MLEYNRVSHDGSVSTVVTQYCCSRQSGCLGLKLIVVVREWCPEIFCSHARLKYPNQAARLCFPLVCLLKHQHQHLSQAAAVEMRDMIIGDHRIYNWSKCSVVKRFYMLIWGGMREDAIQKKDSPRQLFKKYQHGTPPSLSLMKIRCSGQNKRGVVSAMLVSSCSSHLISPVSPPVDVSLMLLSFIYSKQTWF